MPDYDGDEGQENEAELIEEEPRKQRNVVPLWIWPLAVGLSALGLLGYGALTKGPALLEIIRSRDCLVCHAELGDEMKRETVHSPFTAKRCTACHTPHGLDQVESVSLIEQYIGHRTSTLKKSSDVPGGKAVRSTLAPRPSARSALAKPIKQLCADSCHAGLLALGRQKRYQMPPFAKKQCISCHQAHATDQPYLLRSPVKPLCLSCHPQVARYFDSDTVHPPFKAGDCTSCHRGHASNVKPLLRRRPKTLCLGCHPSVAKLMKLPVKMEPFENGNCPQCHNPHGSNNRRLLKEPLPDLCFSCHGGIAKLRSKPVQMPPFRQGLCLGCHRPHASENPKLMLAPLERNQVCYLCHEEYKGNYESIGHSKVVNNASPYQPEGGVGSCLNCHEPHGSDYEGLIQKEVISLCLTCHGPRRYFAHPVGMKWQDPWRGGYLGCTSCHNPMGSGITRLKRRDMDGLCVSCHDSTDPSYIFSKRQSWHRYKIPSAGSNPEPEKGGRPY